MRAITIRSTTDLLTIIVAWMAFMIGLHYYDPGVNMAFLLYTWMGLALLTGLLIATRRAGQLQPLDLGCIAALGLLALHHCFISTSVDSSFAPSMTLAALPVMCLLGQRMDGLRLFGWLVATVLLIALYSTVNYLGWERRAHDPMLDPNNYVTLLYLIWIPWLHWQLAPQGVNPAGAGMLSKLPPLLVGVIVWVFMLAQFATHSRFAWMVTVAAFLYWLLLGRNRPMNWRVLSAAMAAVVLSACTYLVLDIDQATANINSIASGADSASDESVRLVLLQSGWQMVVDAGSWLGSGVYTYALHYPQYRPVVDQANAGLFVHNDYLQLLFEGGVVLLLPLVVLGVCVAVRVLKSLFGATSGSRAWNHRDGFVVAAGLALLHANVNFVLYILPLGMLLGLLLAIGFHQDQPASTGAPATWRSKLTWRMAAPTLLLLMMPPIGYLALDAYSYGVLAGQPGLPFSQSVRANHIQAYADLAHKLNPDRGVPVLATAQLQAAQLGPEPDPAAVQEVVNQFAAAIETDPWNPLAYANLSEVLDTYADGRLGQYEAQALLSQARQMAPQNVDYAVQSMLRLQRTGNTRLALEVALEITRWCPLIKRRGPQDLNRLGVLVTQLNSEWNDPRVHQALALCRAARDEIKVGKRRATWLQNWWGLYDA